MDHLLPEKIRICLPNKKGKALAITADGKLTCDNKNQDLKDDEWIFDDLNLPTEEKGYHIISANYKLAMDYNPKEGEQVNTVPYNGDNHTVWYISPNNEIYSFDNEGEKKYLWSLGGNLYVTHDEYLAEGWDIVNLDGAEAKIVEPKKTDLVVPFLMLLIIVMIIWVVYFRGK